MPQNGSIRVVRETEDALYIRVKYPNGNRRLIKKDKNSQEGKARFVCFSDNQKRFPVCI